MSEEKLNQIESMLSQLITSVGTIMTEQTAVRKDIINIKDEQKAMRKDISQIKDEQKAMQIDISQIKDEQKAMQKDISQIKDGQKAMQIDISQIKDGQKAMRDEKQVRHHEILRRFGRIEADQTYTWKKTVENEREINMLKSQAN